MKIRELNDPALGPVSHVQGGCRVAFGPPVATCPGLREQRPVADEYFHVAFSSASGAGSARRISFGNPMSRTGLLPGAALRARATGRMPARAQLSSERCSTGTHLSPWRTGCPLRDSRFRCGSFLPAIRRREMSGPEEKFAFCRNSPPAISCRLPPWPAVLAKGGRHTLIPPARVHFSAKSKWRKGGGKQTVLWSRATAPFVRLPDGLERGTQVWMLCLLSVLAARWTSGFPYTMRKTELQSGTGLIPASLPWEKGLSARRKMPKTAVWQLPRCVFLRKSGFRSATGSRRHVQPLPGRANRFHRTPAPWVQVVLPVRTRSL